MSPTRARRGAASLLALAALGASLGLLARPGQSAQDKAGKNPLDGTWTVVELTQGGKKIPEGQAKLLQFNFQGDKVTLSVLGKAKGGTLKVDATREPKQFDMMMDGERPNPGIYRLEKDTLTL